MQDFKNCYLPSIIILLFFIRLGASERFNGGDTSSSTNAPNRGKTSLELLNQLLEMKRNNVQEGPKYNITSAVELRSIVKTRFKTEMAMLFSWLPESNKCNILLKVSQTTKCSVPDIIELLFNLTEMKHNLNVSCPFKDRTKFKLCSRADKKFVGDTFCNELLDVFASLPSPFKCHVINTIALAYNFKGRRHLPISVTQAQNTVAEMFPSVSLPQTCADMEMNHIVPSVPPVNITVYLNNVDKDAWLRTLRMKGPVVYRTVLEYEFETRHKGKVLGGHGSPAQFLAEHAEEINSTKLHPVVVEGGNKIFSVLFRLKVKRKQSNRLREIRSTFRIAQALDSKNQKELRTIFNATIISVSLSGERSNITKAPPKTNRWNLNQMNRAKEFFPSHLSAYYRQLGKPARCFVVFYISQKMNRNPKEIEMFYTSFGRFSRKHTCYYTNRTPPTDIPLPNVRTEERFTQEISGLSTYTPSVNRTEISSNGSTNAIDHTSNRVGEEDLSSLEIALFALLGVLCVSVLAFTINCVLLAMKSKAAYQSNNQPRTALQTAVFHKGTNTANCKGNESVHFSERNGCLCQQPSNSQHPPTMETTSCRKKDFNCRCLVSASASYYIRRGDHERTSAEHPLSELGSSGENRTNSRTQLENEYCLNASQAVKTFKSSQRCDNDSVVKDSLETEASSSKDECQCPARVLDSHSSQDIDTVLETQGKAISYCSISDTSCRAAQPAKMMHAGRLPSEEAHETVIVLLDCEGYKEVPV